MSLLRNRLCVVCVLSVQCLAYRMRPSSAVESEVIPDKQFYQNLAQKPGPEKLTEDQQRLLDERIERCYAPRSDKNYKTASYRDAIDDYMNRYVRQGLKKLSRVFVYDMPHVWGKHWYTKYFPHHWMAGVIPDNEKKPTSHCLEFDYQEAEKNQPSADPNGCLFFEKSFKRTQGIVRCVKTALESSPNWKAHKVVTAARSSLHKVEMQFSVNGVTSNPIELTHAKWNDSPKMHTEEFVAEVACKKAEFWRKEETQCPNGARKVMTYESCTDHWSDHSGNKVDGKELLLCAKYSTGSDDLWKEKLAKQTVKLGGTSCAYQAGIYGAVALIQPGGGCSNMEKVGNATDSGAIAVILVTENTFSGKRDAMVGRTKPAPTFTIDVGEGESLVQKLFGVSMSEVGSYRYSFAFVSHRVHIHSYLPVAPEDAQIIPKFADEVRFFQEDRDDELTESATDYERTWEVLKHVTLAELGSNMSAADARRAIAAGIQKSMTQSERSQLPAIDVETGDAIAKCYGFEGDGSVSDDALVNHEASKCLPLMWDKVEVSGPPWPQAWEASGSFPSGDIQAIDALNVHPICSRLSLSLNMQEMYQAPYPDPKEWGEEGFGPDKIKLSTAWDALKKGNPHWISNNFFEYCLNPDTALCTSFTVCWALLTRRITKFIHPYCDERRRAYPEQEILE